MEKEIGYIQTYIIFLKLIYLYLFLRQKGSSSFTAGYAGDDVSGSLNLDYRKKSGKLDYYASSMGYSLNGTKKINSVQVTGKSDRLDEKYMEIYVSKNGNDWTKIDSANLGFMKTSDGLKVIFRESIEASYIKIHSTWDERDEDYKPVDKSEVYGNIADIVEVYYLAEGKKNSYTYDAKGNRITYRGYTGTVPEETLIEYYQYSDLLKRYGDWYFSYDANGNLTARGNGAEWNPAAKSYEYSETDGELWAYEYDLSNRLTKVLHSENGRRNLTERASYTYDYRGLCVVKNSEDGKEYREYTADGKLIYTEKGEDRTDYIYKSNTVFAEIRRGREGEAVYYHHTDHLGTTRAVSDENGAVVWEAETEAFGSVLSENGTKVFTASYTGKLYDEDAEMYYFNARWYDSEIGRFITEDPARDGVNWYAYCNGNPLVKIDPDGLEIKTPGDILQYSASEGGKLGNGTLNLRDYSCTLTTFVRMAEAYGYKGGIDFANDVAKDNNLFTNKDELTPENGAKLATLLIGNASIEIQFDKSIYGDANKLAVGLNSKENEKSLYFATLRMKTSAKDSKEEYPHSLSIGHNSVFVNDVNDIGNALGFKYIDTSTADRKDTNDNSRINKPYRIDFFKIVYKNWAMLENGE